jgi:ATP-dependent RNA helicase DHR2
MPERLHTKFGDDDDKLQPVSAATGADHNASAPGGQKQIDGKNNKAAGQTNGVSKRRRDGSPKSSLDPAVSQQDEKRGNLKKQRRNSNEPSQPAPKINSATPKGVDMEASQKAIAGKDGQNIQNGTSLQPRPGFSPQALQRRAKELEKNRQELPIWPKRLDIRYALRKNDILLLNGETGSGKSTQTPQYLYTEPWCKRKSVKIKNKEGRQEEISVGGIIAITQPRRVAAIELAKRVAAELGSPIVEGTFGQGTVGYSVRFQSAMPRRGLKIKFLTEGMLLQEMLRDPNLRQYSAVIVDEIHERSVDVDLIAGFLRKLIHGDKEGRGGIPLKVVIMSATLDLGGLEAFFGKPEIRPEYKPGQNHGRTLAPHLLENVESPQSAKSYSSWSGISSSDDDPSPSKRSKSGEVAGFRSASDPPVLGNKSDANGINGKTSPKDKGAKGKANCVVSKPIPAKNDDCDEHPVNHEGVARNGVAVEYVEGRQYQVNVFYDSSPNPDYLDSMLKVILKLHTTQALPGDILAFLTGQEEIETLQNQLEHYATLFTKGVPRMKVMPLYGSLPGQAQQAAFEKVKEKFTRKIVLATNIAETSVTVSGVHYVVDCGKNKVKQFRPRLGMESLLSVPTSKVSAIQRAGRAGREAKGKCYRLYTEDAFKHLELDEKPEILRSDVIEAVLKMKARGVDDVLDFPLMDQPDIVAMEKALVQLHIMGAINDDGQLTAAGKKMAAYPLPAAYGRVVVAAGEARCLLEIIDIIACLTTDSEVFLHSKSEEDQVAIEEHRKGIHHPKGDILTYLKTMQLYASENTDRPAWCQKHAISVRAMRMAMNIRKQLRQACLSQRLLTEAPSPDPQPFEELSPERAELILKTFLKAFASKTAVLGGDGQYLTTVGRNPIAIHPSSVLHGKKLEGIMFLEHVFTAKSYAKKVSAIQANWIAEAFEA